MPAASWGVEILEAKLPQVMTVITSYPTLSTISTVSATSGPQLSGNEQLRAMLGTVLKPTHLLTEQASHSPTYMSSPWQEPGDDSVPANVLLDLKAFEASVVYSLSLQCLQYI